MTGETRTRIARLTEVAVLVGAVWLGASHGLAWLVLFPVVILGARAMLPEENPMLTWPVGLLLTLVASYVAHVIAWFDGSIAMTAGWSRSVFLAVSALFGLVYVSRRPQHREHWEWRRGSMTRIPVALVLAALPLFLLVMATLRLNSDPQWLMSGFIAGGDHSGHAEVIRALVAPDLGEALEGPLSLYAYPRAIHHLIALLTVIGNPVGVESDLVTIYASAAWFEYVQLAAYISAALLAFRRFAEPAGLMLVLVVPTAVLAVASLPSFVFHLFWSGFTTSLGITWILMVTFAVIGRAGDRGDRVRDDAIFLILVAVAAWVVYQPFVLAPLCVLGGILATEVVRRRAGGLVAGESWVAPLAMSVGPALVVLALLVVPGRESHLVRTFLLDGDLRRPWLMTVVLWIAVAALVLGLGRSAGAGRERAPLWLLLGLVGMTTGFAIIVSMTSSSGMFSLPYYVQKMMWVLLYVSLPIGLGGITGALVRVARSPSMRWAPYAGAVLLLMIPFLTRQTPVNATRHYSPDWFVSTLTGTPNLDLTRTVAYVPTDPLGSHLSNLALQLIGSPDIPREISLGRHAYAACRIINSRKVRTVITEDYAVGALLGAGCLPTRSYLGPSGRWSMPDVPYFPMKMNHRYKFGATNLGRFLMLRGFNEPETWGTWATGYMSALGLQFPRDTEETTVVLTLAPPPEGASPRRVRLYVEHREQGVVTLSDSSRQMIQFDLGSRRAGEKIEIAMDCDWSVEDAMEAEERKEKRSCLGLEEIRVIDDPRMLSAVLAGK